MGLRETAYTILFTTTMDLDGFEQAADRTAHASILLSGTPTGEEVLKYIDANWYIPTSRRGRWMDLMGDYAGSEMFVLDGTQINANV